MDSRNGPHLKAALLPLPTELPLLKPDERLLARLHIVDFCLLVQSSRSASWIDRIGLSVTGNLGEICGCSTMTKEGRSISIMILRWKVTSQKDAAPASQMMSAARRRREGNAVLNFAGTGLRLPGHKAAPESARAAYNPQHDFPGLHPGLPRTDRQAWNRR